MRAAALVRPARREDARPIAEVHVASWRHAYRGLLPDDYLEKLSVDERHAQRLAWFADPRPGSGVLVAEDEAGRVVGFATFGPSRDYDAPEGTGEVPAIYVDPPDVGKGIGRELFAETAAALRKAGYTRATLWVLEENASARRFYEKAGWTRDGAVSTHDFDCANDRSFATPWICSQAGSGRPARSSSFRRSAGHADGLPPEQPKDAEGFRGARRGYRGRGGDR